MHHPHLQNSEKKSDKKAFFLRALFQAVKKRNAVKHWNTNWTEKEELGLGLQPSIPFEYG